MLFSGAEMRRSGEFCSPGQLGVLLPGADALGACGDLGPGPAGFQCLGLGV